MGAPSGSRVAFLAYFHLGCATLFPWSALITAADFWESQFPGKHMDRLLTVAYLPANLAALAVLLRHGSRLTPRMRVVGGFTGYTAIMLAVPLQAKLLTPSTPVLVCLLALVACAGVCDGAVQGALYGEAAGYPTTLFTRALTSGSSMAGVVVAFLRLATKATLPETPAGLAASASLYFLLAAAVTGGASAVYGWVLPRLAAVRHYRTIALEAALLGGVGLEGGEGGGVGGRVPRLAPAALDPFLSSAGVDPYLSPTAKVAQQRAALAAGYMELSSHTPPRTPPRPSSPRDSRRGLGGEAHHRHPHHLSHAELGGEAHAAHALPAAAAAPALPAAAAAARPKEGEAVRAAPPRTSAVLNHMWKLAVSLTCTFAVTLTIFPGVLAEDEHSEFLGSWYPELLIATFALADWAGKNAPSMRLLRTESRTALLWVAIARAGFVPAFRLAAERQVGPPIVGGLTAALGATNGWVTACAMMAAPNGLHGAAASLAGTISVFSIVLGLCCGALLSFAWLL